jgi:hypothetical protein
MWQAAEKNRKPDSAVAEISFAFNTFNCVLSKSFIVIQKSDEKIEY